MISEYMNFSNKNLIGNYSLNVVNIYTVYYLLEKGLLNIPVSVELDQEEINNLYHNFINTFNFTPSLELLVYGRVENMIIKGNILNIKEDTNYNLVDKRNRCFKVYCKNNLTHILNYEQLNNNYNYDFNYLKRYDFYEENKSAIIDIVNKLK